MAPAASKRRCPQAMLSLNKGLLSADKNRKFNAGNNFIKSSNNNVLEASKIPGEQVFCYLFYTSIKQRNQHLPQHCVLACKTTHSQQI